MNVKVKVLVDVNEITSDYLCNYDTPDFVCGRPNGGRR